MIHLTSSIGDFRVLTIALEKDGLPFVPSATTGTLIFTAKRSYNAADSAAIIQKSTTAGIALAGANALVSIFREDTLALDPCKLFFEILWQDTGSLLAQPVAVGILDLNRRLTRGQQTSVAVVSSTTPLPFGGLPVALTAAPVDGDYALSLSGSLLRSNGSTLPTPFSLTRIADNAYGKQWQAIVNAVPYTLYRNVNGVWSIDSPDASYVAVNPATTSNTPVGLTGWTLVFGTGQPVLSATPGTVATAIGQFAIVTHSDGSWSEWGCVAITPTMRWLPRTAGILKRANGRWYRTTLAADGTAEYNLLPDQ